MRRNRNYHVLTILFIFSVLIVGCARTKIVDKIGIIHVYGMDTNDKGELVATALIPEFAKSKSSDIIKYLEEENNNSPILVSELSTKTNTPMRIAKIRVLLFGNKFARTGIRDIVKRFILTPELGTNIQIAVSTESARETLKKFKKEKSLTLADQIEQNMRDEFIPFMNLHVFLNNFFGEGMDAYAPLITVDRQERLKIIGLGIFKGDKLKLHLNSEESSIFSLLVDEKTNANYKIELDGNNRNEMIAIRFSSSKNKWVWDKKKKELNLRLKVQITLTQYPERFKMHDEKDYTKLKNIIEEKIQNDIQGIIKKFKENEVDPIGLGNIVRSQDRNWDKNKFYQMYSELPIHVNVELEIIHSGLAD